MHMDPAVPAIVGALAVVLATGLLLRALRQPYVVAYLIAGVAMGPAGLDLFTDADLLNRAGAVGVMLLLFFVGLEVSPKQLLAGWRISIVGTLMQVVASVALVWGLGWVIGWPTARIVLLGFVISLSSTAVILKVLQDAGELDSRVGRDVLGVLLAQDFAVIPMLLIVGLLGDQKPAPTELAMQAIGAILIVGVMALLTARPRIQLPFMQHLQGDHEAQVFAALLTTFGFAWVTGALHLSAALGAFVAGMVVAAEKDMNWVHHALDPFRVVFVALFFVSVGLLVDVRLLWERWWVVGLLVATVFVTNTLLNAVILRVLGRPWGEALHGGALLAQIGELSFVLAAVGLQNGALSDYGYRLAVAVIALSLAVSPMWIAITRRAFRPRGAALRGPSAIQAGSGG